MTTRVLSSVPAALPSFGRSATAAAAAVTSRCVDVVGLSRVKRCLFADAVATATLAATAQQQRDDALQAAALELRRQVVHDSQRWNFDFVNDAPLPGRFVWADAIAKATPKAAPTPATPAPASSSSSETRMRQAHITGNHQSFFFTLPVGFFYRVFLFFSFYEKTPEKIGRRPRN